MKNIVVTGSLAFDYIMDFPGTFEEHILPEKLKTLSVSFLVQNLNKNFGGTAGNITYNLALLQTSPMILASAGKKDFDAYFEQLKKTGIQTDLIKIIENEYTASAYIMTDKNNCQITGFYEGTMKYDTKLSIPSESSFVVIAPTIPKAMEKFAKEAKRLKIPFLFGPAQQIPAFQGETLERTLEGAEIIIGNDYEIALIMQKTSLSKKDLLKKAKILVTTLGKQGSLIETNSQRIPVGIVKPEKIVDPTGAGDAYIAGFIAGYTRQLPLQICGQMGATAATYAIEHYGTQNHRFTLEQFKKRYGKAFGEVVEL